MTECKIEETPIGKHCATHDVIYGGGECPYKRIATLEAEIESYQQTIKHEYGKREALDTEVAHLRRMLSKYQDGES